MSERIDKLREAIETMHKCKARHVGSQRVTETFRSEVAWDGVVETFDIEGHPKAKRCYAWSFSENGEPQYATVLEIPPVDSPESAVKVAIAAKSRKPITLTEFAQMGGFARARKLSKEYQREIARKAGKASGEARRRQPKD